MADVFGFIDKKFVNAIYFGEKNSAGAVERV